MKRSSLLAVMPVGSSSRPVADFQGVLDAQKAPSLEVLFSMYGAAVKLSRQEQERSRASRKEV